MASALPPLLQATAGATGSAVANAIVFPMALVTTRLQIAEDTPKTVQKKANPFALLSKLIRQKGLASVYDGLAADTINTITSSFLYYYLWSLGRKILAIRQSRKTGKPAVVHAHLLSPWEELGVGLMAGIVCKTITLPASNISVRQQADETSELGMAAAARQMMRENGVRTFWAGLAPSLPLALLPSLSLYLNNLLKRLLIPRSRRNHPPGSVTFALGALSNALAILPLYPLLLLKTLYQAGRRASAEGRQESFFQSVRRISHEHGVAGLYKGIEAQLLKSLMSQGVALLIKQRVEQGVVAAYKRNRAA